MTTRGDAYEQTDDLRQSVKAKVRAIILAAGEFGAALDEIKQGLRDQGENAHHGTVSSAITSLWYEGEIKRREDRETREGNSGLEQNVWIIGKDPHAGPRPDLPSMESFDKFRHAMLGSWPAVAGLLRADGEDHVEAAVEMMQYLRDLNVWRRGCGARK